MSNRNILILAILIGILALATLTAALFWRPPATPRAPVEVLPVKLAVPAAVVLPEVAAADLAAHDLFSPVRGKTVESPPTPEPKQQQEQPAAPQEPALNMLSGYPDDWPRLKLTGIFRLGNQAGAVISGGDTFTVDASGQRYPRLYRVGETISGGVILARVEDREVTLRKENNALKIAIGVEPPAVKEKK